MSRRTVDIVILFEKAVRELDVACALKVILERRYGLSAEIVQQNYPDESLIRGLEPRVVALPFCYQERSNNAFFLRWRRATYFNLTWEQLFYPGNATAKTPRGEFAINHVIHNAWSQAYVDLLRAQGVPAKHIFLSGNPAYTLYDEPYRRFFKARSTIAGEYGLDPGRRWVFFPENYNWAFYETAMLEQMVFDGQPAEQVADMRRAVTLSFEEAMRWCARFVERTGAELILRPRPATPVEVFRDRVIDVIGEIPARLTITQGDTVREWILAADVVVSSYSTSLIEASITGKPAYIVESVRWPESLRQDWHALAPRLTSQEEFTAVATKAVNSVGPSQLGRWAREALMGQGDSILLIADQLARISRGEAVVPPTAPWQSITLPSLRRLPRRVLYELRRHVRPRLQTTPPPIPSESRADVDAVREMPERVERWRGVLNEYLATIDRVA